MGIEKYKLFIYGAGKYGKLLLRHINIILGGGGVLITSYRRTSQTVKG